MRILITGGLGFVGGRLAVHLVQLGHQIVLGSRKAINPPVWLPQAEVAQIVWEDDGKLERSCNGVDVVVQAAGMNAQDCAADPVAALAFNGVATSRLVAAASRADVQRFIYLSTAHVYASPLVGDITEETCPSNIHPYATSHIAGEHAVLSASQRGQIQGGVLRLSNAFGAPMHRDVNCWMLLVNDLCKQAVQTGTLLLQSSGLQQRDFIGLTDVCRVAERFLIGKDEALPTGIYNVGAGWSQSVLAMAQLIQQRCTLILGFQPELKSVQSEVGEQCPALDYRVDKITALGGISVHIDCSAEIDSLLRYCQSTFAKNRVLAHE